LAEDRTPPRRIRLEPHQRLCRQCGLEVWGPDFAADAPLPDGECICMADSAETCPEAQERLAAREDLRASGLLKPFEEP